MTSHWEYSQKMHPNGYYRKERGRVTRPGQDDQRGDDAAGCGESGLTSLRWATSANLDEKVVRLSGILSLA